MRINVWQDPWSTWSKWWASRRCAQVGVLVGAVLGWGCASDTTGPAVVNPAQLYTKLMLNHHAITLALTPPYNTLPLAAKAYAATGAPLADSGVTTWTSSDSSVTISPTGTLTGVAAVSQVTIQINRTIGGVTQSDQALVTVTDVTPVPHPASLTLTPQPTLGRIPEYDLLGYMQFTPTVVDATGQPIPNVPVYEVSLTPMVLRNRTSGNKELIESWWTGVGSLLFERSVPPGYAQIVGDATVYGVHLVDTVSFTVGWERHVVVTVVPQTVVGQVASVGVFLPGDDTVASGGVVFWKNALGRDSVDVVFEDSTAVQGVDSAIVLGGFICSSPLCLHSQEGGNISAFGPPDSLPVNGNSRFAAGVRARSFPVPGTYRYHSVRYGTSGVIHVLPEFQIP